MKLENLMTGTNESEMDTNVHEMYGEWLNTNYHIHY